MRQLAHDSFSRVNTYKRVSRKRSPFRGAFDDAETGCHECGSFDGHGLVYRFTVQPDDSPRPASSWSAHEFCSVACWRAYNS